MKTFKTLLLAGLVTISFISCETEEANQNSPEVSQEELGDVNDILAKAIAETPAPKNDQPLQTVDFVQVDKYVGQWFELANYPSFFSQGCSCTTANYSPIDGGIAVFNECTLLADGASNGINGQALVADTATNSKFKLSFGGPFVGDYWIIDLVDFNEETPYDFAVVSDPTRTQLFLLSRTPKITTFRQKFALFRLFVGMIRQGFDLTKLEVTPQLDGCVYPS